MTVDVSRVNIYIRPGYTDLRKGVNGPAYPGIRHVGCFSHARRRFFEAAKVSKKGGLAEEGIGYIVKTPSGHL